MIAGGWAYVVAAYGLAAFVVGVLTIMTAILRRRARRARADAERRSGDD